MACDWKGFQRSGTHNLQGNQEATLREATEGPAHLLCLSLSGNMITHAPPHFCLTQLTLKFNINAARFCYPAHIQNQSPTHRGVTILFQAFHLWPLWRHLILWSSCGKNQPKYNGKLSKKTVENPLTTFSHSVTALFHHNRIYFILHNIKTVLHYVILIDKSGEKRM